MAIIKGMLPRAYKRLHSITSTGTQFINTGYNNYGIFVIDCSFESSTGRTLVGFSTNAGNYFEKNADNKLAMGANNVVNVDVTTRRVITFTRTSEAATISCNSLSSTRAPQEASLSSYSFKFMGAGISTGTTYNGGMTFYNLKIYSLDNKLIREYVPCERLSDNAIGVYEIFSGTFLGNAGTGRFLNLPSTYEQVEYIESTGTQYIDTGLLPSDTFGFKVNVTLTQQTENAKFGVNQTSGSDYRCWWGCSTNSNKYRSYLGWGTLYPSAGANRPETSVNVEHVVEGNFLNNRKYRLDDVDIYSSLPTLEATYTRSFLLFAANDGGTIYTSDRNTRISRAIFTRGSSVIMDLIPCYRVSDNEIGMFDLVSGSFYTNVGTGTFVAGSLPLPSEYQRVEYVRTNKSAYVMTGLTVNQFDRVTAKIDLQAYDTERAGNNYAPLFACRTGVSGAQNAKLFRFCDGGVPDCWSALYDDTWTTDWTTYNAYLPPLNTILDYDIKFANGEQYVKIGGTTYGAASISGGTLSNTYEVPLFAQSNGGSVNDFCDLKCYRLTMYMGDTIVRDFIPCYRKSDNVAGIYDTVNNVFYTSSGTSNFTAGPDVETELLSKEYIPYVKKMIKNNKKIIRQYQGDSIVFNPDLITLPDEYEELAYIANTIDNANTGGSWIDTGRKGTQNTKVEIKVQYPATPSTTAIAFGARGYNSSTANAFLFGVTSSYQFYARFGNGTPTENRQPFDTSIHTITNSKDGCYLDETKIATYTSGQNFTTDENLALFICWDGPNPSTSLSSRRFPAICRIYSYKVWESNVLVQDLVPCFRKSDGIIGMYDRISGNFLTNQGTGKFAKGLIKVSLPSEYQRVEYLKSTGTQYIDTSIVPTDTFGCSIDILLPQLPSSDTGEAQFGCRQDSGTTRCFWVVSTTGSSYAGWNTTTPGTSSRPTISTNQFYNIKLNYLNDRCFKQDNVAYSTDLQTLNSISKSFYLFGCNNFNGITLKANFVKGASFTSANEVVMKLVPCMRKSDGELGMYDLVGRSFLTNAGTGTFERGRIILENDAYQEVEYIKSDGNQHLETNYYPGLNTEVVVDYVLTAYNGTEVNYIFGVYEANKLCAIYKRSSSNNDKFGVMFSNLDATTSVTMELNTPYNVVLNKTEATVNGTSVKDIGAATVFTSSKNIYIFRGNGSSRPSAIMKLYDFIVKENSVKVMHLIPCYRRADNVIGMFDLISKTFLTNAGTGSFTKGNDIN